MGKPPTNAQLGKMFIDHLSEQGLEVYVIRYRPQGDPYFISKKALFVLPKGQGGTDTSLAQFQADLQSWLNANNRPKSLPQIQRILKAIWPQVDHRDEYLK